MTQMPAGLIPHFTIADRLRKARETTGLGQSEFAKELGISRGTVSNYENGSSKPKEPYLMAWALRTGVPLVWLKEGKEPSDPDGPNGSPAPTTKRRTVLPRLDSNQQPSAYGLRAVA